MMLTVLVGGGRGNVRSAKKIRARGRPSGSIPEGVIALHQPERD